MHQRCCVHQQGWLEVLSKVWHFFGAQTKCRLPMAWPMVGFITASVGPVIKSPSPESEFTVPLIESVLFQAFRCYHRMRICRGLLANTVTCQHSETTCCHSQGACMQSTTR